MVKFYLDSIQVDAPANWEDFTLKLARDKSIDALLLSSDTTLEWIGTGYDYIAQLLNTNGFCGSVELNITDDEPTLTDVYLGRIFLSSCEINEAICSIKTKVEDRSFYAMVNNNKGIEADLTAGLSKAGVSISVTDNYFVQCHNVVAGTPNRQVYTVRVFEAFRYLVAFMTDDTVQFASDTFDIGGAWEGLTITTGLKLRTGTSTNPPLTPFSFRDLYSEVKKKIPIGMTVTESAGVYTLRIEDIDYFNQSNGSFKFQNIEGITTKFNEDKLYSSVRVGSTNVDPSQTFPETQPIIGYVEEQLWNDITCNIDNELDLVSSWVISSNVIEDCVTNGATVYDEDLFLMTTILSDPNTGIATATDTFNSGVDFFYNDELRNINVLGRYTNGIPSTAVQYFNGTPSNFYALKSNTETISRQVTIFGNGTINYSGITGTISRVFDNDSTPPGDDPYNVYLANMVSPITANNTFTAPVDAYYNFEAFANVNISGVVTGTITCANLLEQIRIFNTPPGTTQGGRLKYDLYNAGGTLIANNVIIGQGLYGRYNKTYSFNNNANSPYIVTGTIQPRFFSLYMRAGDIIVIDIDLGFLLTYNTQVSSTPSGFIRINESITLNQGSYFRCIGNSTDNPNLQVGNINEYIAYEHNFSCPMTSTEFTYLKDNSRDLIEFSMFGRTPRYGWVSDIKYNWIKGTATVKLESNATNNNI